MNEDRLDHLVPELVPAEPRQGRRKAAYVVVALASFLAGLMWSQCTLQRSEGKSRVDWPQSKPGGFQNPRKL